MTYGQEERIKLVSLEGSINFIGGKRMDYEYIRDDVSDYGYYANQDTKNVRTIASMGTVGLRVEFRSLTNKFALTSGLQYAQLNSHIDKSFFGHPLDDFYYFMVNESDAAIEYLKIRSINQTSDYIGVPVNLIWYPFKQRVFTVYFKGGVDFNYQLSTKTDVVFVDQTMGRFSDVVLNKFEKPKRFVSVFNTRAGVKIGNESKFTFLFEMGPTAFLTERASGILNTDAGFEVRGGVQIPF